MLWTPNIGNGKNWITLVFAVILLSGMTLAYGIEWVGNNDLAAGANEHATLVELYTILNGAHWKRGWNTSDCSYCNWSGVFCTDNGRVQQLLLGSNNLTGPFPSSLFAKFTALDLIDLQSNQISGPIEPFASSTLRSLTASTNRITGTLIAFQPEQLPSLITIDLHNNLLIGSLPDYWDRWHNLTTLHFANNQLNGTIPSSWSTLTNLQFLTLTNNLFAPQWFSEWMVQLPRLKKFVCSQCNFIGEFPRNITSLLLNNLDIHQNRLSGPLSDSLCDLSRLELFRCNQNDLSGALPTCLGRLQKLNTMYIGRNRFSGELPTGLFQIGLEDLVLESNQFTGILPSFGRSFQMKIQRLILHNNRLSGEMPVFTGIYLNLVALDASNNNFTGTIPLSSFTPGLTTADFSNNNFTISFEFSVLQSLAYGGRLSSVNIAGNPYLVSPEGGQLPAYMSLTDDQVRSGNFYCLRVTLVETSYFRLTTDPHYFQNAFCHCLPYFYGSPPNCISVASLANTNCSEGGNTLSWSRGYYPVIIEKEDGTPTILAAEPCTEWYAPMDLSDCNPVSNCSFTFERGINHCQVCAPGSTGRLCSQCVCESSSDCHFASSSFHCVLCEASTLYVLIIIMITVVVVLIIASIVIVRNYQKPSRNDAVSLMKITIVHIQLTAALNTQWHLPALVSLLKAFKLFNGQATGYGVICFFPFLANPVYNLTTTLCLPFVVVIIMWIIVLLVHFIQDRRAKYAGAHAAAAVPSQQRGQEASLDVGSFKQDVEYNPLLSRPIVNDLDSSMSNDDAPLVSLPTLSRRLVMTRLAIDVFLVLYFTLALQILSIFNCQLDYTGTKRYLQDLPWLECSNDTKYGTLRLLAGLSIFPYILGIPLVLAVLMRYYRSEINAGRVPIILTGVCLPFRKSSYWFELVLLGRRLLIGLILAAIPNSSLYQPTAVCLVLILYSMLHLRWLPFYWRLANIAEQISSQLLLMTYVAQLSWRSSQVSDTTMKEHDQTDDPHNIDVIALSWVGLVANLGFICILVAIALFHTARKHVKSFR